MFPNVVVTCNVNLADWINLMQLCPICLSNSKDMAFGCGHQVNTTIFLLLLLEIYEVRTFFRLGMFRCQTRVGVELLSLSTCLYRVRYLCLCPWFIAQKRSNKVCSFDILFFVFFLSWQTCCECGKELKSCPICRSSIKTRIKLY
jgi:E3 ubiquitin-protein ligase RGLG